MIQHIQSQDLDVVQYLKRITKLKSLKNLLLQHVNKEIEVTVKKQRLEAYSYANYSLFNPILPQNLRGIRFIFFSFDLIWAERHKSANNFGSLFNFLIFFQFPFKIYVQFKDKCIDLLKKKKDPDALHLRVKI